MKTVTLELKVRFIVDVNERIDIGKIMNKITEVIKRRMGKALQKHGMEQTWNIGRKKRKKKHRNKK